MVAASDEDTFSRRNLMRVIRAPGKGEEDDDDDDEDDDDNEGDDEAAEPRVPERCLVGLKLDIRFLVSSTSTSAVSSFLFPFRCC